jgi:hypothetical protein
MNKHVYQDIIHHHLAPFAEKKFNFKAKLHQDNDSKHTSVLCTNALRNLKTKWVNKQK